MAGNCHSKRGDPCMFLGPDIGHIYSQRGALECHSHVIMPSELDMKGVTI